MEKEPVSLLILAGGRSQRMGQDKLWMEWEDRPLVERVTCRVLPLAAEVVFSANSPELFRTLIERLPVPARVVADRYPGAGPLGGLHAGLEAARHELVLTLAADLPFVNLALVSHMVALADGYDAVVPQTPHPITGTLHWEPLHAFYRRNCLPAIVARLAAGERQTFCFLGDVHVRIVSPAEIRRYDPELTSFLNVNTPEEWQRSQRLAQST
ncbi:MAG: molybdenum cofactor guanylyltransferase [Chloroflexi bacterium HGW-Chloroflexi-1]|nr:MAG: molybdenum cofactor guanylyltransferase [Chloroflexi bacterium HGW-Chloroflexi-1]